MPWRIGSPQPETQDTRRIRSHRSWDACSSPLTRQAVFRDGGGGALHLSVTDEPRGTSPRPRPDIWTGVPVTGLIGTADDADYFRLVLGQPTLVSIYTIGGLDTVGRLMNSAGREVAANDDGGKLSNFQIQANLPQGIHYVQIRASGNATGNYELHAYAQTPAPAEFTNSIGMDFALGSGRRIRYGCRQR